MFRKLFVGSVAFMLLTFASSMAQLASELNVNSVAQTAGPQENPDPTKCRIQFFRDPFPSMAPYSDKRREYRWKVSVPDGSRCDVLYATGKVPENGVPKLGTSIIPKGGRFPPESGDIVLVVRANELLEYSFEFTVFPGFEEGNNPPIQGISERNVDWLPYFGERQAVLENPPLDSVSSFAAAGDVLVMKHYVRNATNEPVGFAIWLSFSDMPKGAPDTQ